MMRMAWGVWVLGLWLVQARRAFAEGFSLGIESMRSHSYSVGIFVFMMIAMAVFVGIVIGYMRGSSLKRGEKAMIGAILVGVVIAGIFAALQLLEGFLF